MEFDLTQFTRLDSIDNPNFEVESCCGQEKKPYYVNESSIFFFPFWLIIRKWESTMVHGSAL